MEDKKFAILIDSDNISSKYIAAVMDEMMQYGIATYRRIYGDWTSSQAKSWKNHLQENSLIPIQQFNNTVGKNSTDSALIIDAMDILYTGNVDGFGIVSSDGDFTRLASRLRESGMLVIGLGEKKTPASFRKACSQFIFLENLVDADEEAQPEAADQLKTAASQSEAAASQLKIAAEGKGENLKNISAKETDVVSKEVIENAIINIITENENKNKTTELGEIGNRLVNKYPDFDVRNYGYSLLSKFLKEIHSIELVETKNRGIDVRIRENVKSKDEITEYIKELVDPLGTKGIGVSEVSNKVHERYIRFNLKDYGYSKFTKFLQDISELEMFEDHSRRMRVRKRRQI